MAACAWCGASGSGGSGDECDQNVSLIKVVPRGVHEEKQKLRVIMLAQLASSEPGKIISLVGRCPGPRLALTRGEPSALGCRDVLAARILTPRSGPRHMMMGFSVAVTTF
jgi:hypothetical protein